MDQVPGAPRGVISPSDSVHSRINNIWFDLGLSHPHLSSPSPCHLLTFYSPTPLDQASLLSRAGGFGHVYSSKKERKRVNDESWRPGGAPTPARAAEGVGGEGALLGQQCAGWRAGELPG